MNNRNFIPSLSAVLIAAALFVPSMAQADDNGCDFAPPTPLVAKNAYSAQSFAYISDNSAVETAALGNGVMLTIIHDQCVDEASHDFLLTAPNDPAKQGFVAWTDFARDVLRNLKMSDTWSTAELIDFLEKARALQPKDGAVFMCRDGRVQDDCNWDTGGMMSVKVRPGEETTQVTVSESVSG